jgi:hypothetical protein
VIFRNCDDVPGGSRNGICAELSERKPVPARGEKSRFGKLALQHDLVAATSVPRNQNFKRSRILGTKRCQAPS